MPRPTRSLATAAKSSCHQVPALAHRLGVPRRPVLAAAADVGEHVGAAARQPQPAEHTVVARRARRPRTRRSRSSSVGPGPSRFAVADHEVRESACRRPMSRSVASTSRSSASKNAGRRLDLLRAAAGLCRAAAATGCRNRLSPGRFRRRCRRRATITVLVAAGMSGHRLGAARYPGRRPRPGWRRRRA